MKIIILSREELEELSQNPFPQNTGIIFDVKTNVF